MESKYLGLTISELEQQECEVSKVIRNLYYEIEMIKVQLRDLNKKTDKPNEKIEELTIEIDKKMKLIEEQGKLMSIIKEVKKKTGGDRHEWVGTVRKIEKKIEGKIDRNYIIGAYCVNKTTKRNEKEVSSPLIDAKDKQRIKDTLVNFIDEYNINTVYIEGSARINIAELKKRVKGIQIFYR